MVGFEQTFFREMEDVCVIEMCAVVFEPNIDCPIKFPFQVELYTTEGSAGNYGLYNSSMTGTSYLCQLKHWIMEHFI